MKQKMPKGDVKTATSIAVLQEQVKTIKENDLVHIAADVKTVDDKVEKLDGKVDLLSGKIEDVKDEFKIFVAKWGAVVSIIFIIIEIISWFKK